MFNLAFSESKSYFSNCFPQKIVSIQIVDFAYITLFIVKTELPLWNIPFLVHNRHVLCVDDFVEISDFDGDASRVQNITMFIKTLKMDSTDIELFKYPKTIEKY